MANKKRFDKIGTNESYYGTHRDEAPTEKVRDEKNQTSIFNKIGRKMTGDDGSFLGFDPKNVPDKKQESSKFTFEKNRKSEVFRETIVPTKVQSPPVAPFVLTLCVFILLLLSNFLLTGENLKGLSETKQLLVITLCYAAIYLVPSAVYIISERDRKKLYNIRPFSPSLIPFSIVMLFLMMCLAELQKYYIAYSFSYSEAVAVTAGNLWPLLLINALLPAVCEEIFIHGILQHEITKYGGGLCGIFVSGPVFAFIHLDVRYLAIYLVSGMILSVLTHVTRSCIPALFAHLLSNSASVLLSSRLSFVATERIGGTLFMVILALLSFAFVIIALRMAQSISEDRAAGAKEFYLKKRAAEEKNEPFWDKFPKYDRLTSPEGRTFLHLIRVVFSPFMLIVTAIFILAVAVF